MMSLNLFTFCQPLGNYDKMKGYQRWCGCGAIDGLAAWLGSDDINGISCEMVERKSLLVNTMSSGPLQIWQIPSVKVWIYLLKCSYRGVHLFDWLTFFPLSHSINSFSALHKYVQLLLKGWDTPILRNLKDRLFNPARWSHSRYKSTLALIAYNIYTFSWTNV